VLVSFRKSDVLCVGDIINATAYPIIKVDEGGSINGEIDALNRILDITVPDWREEGGTNVIPGHGHIYNEADVADYRDMMTIIRDRVADLIRQGKTLEETKAARPTRDYDRRYSTPAWTGDMLVEAVYLSLKAGPAR
jgi:glyoxylase-like metal-dependent hydrolase (beta-lactamase superfamily II)